jgi:hypothetical protein
MKTRFQLLMLLAIFICFFVLFAFLPCVHAMPLWQKAEYGMNQAEVEKQYPGKQMITLVNHRFEVVFAYDEGKLFAVTLACRDKLADWEARQVFDALTNLLIEKYGKPTTIIAASTIDWQLGKIAIKLECLSMGHGSHVSILYTLKELTSQAVDSAKL